jgi:hypothetical protein
MYTSGWWCISVCVRFVASCAPEATTQYTVRPCYPAGAGRLAPSRLRFALRAGDFRELGVAGVRPVGHRGVPVAEELPGGLVTARRQPLRLYVPVREGRRRPPLP